jgi:hypothetical protein
MPFIGRRREGDGVVEEKRSAVSGVLQCFYFE